MAYTITKRPDHAIAFSNIFRVIWGATPLQNELENLSYFRAMTCFLGSEEDDLADRRRLIYAYLQNDFAHNEITDTIVQLYNILPIEESVNRILRNLCTLYSQTPNRKFDSDSINEVYELADIDTAFRQAHRIAKFCNTCLVMPVVREYNGVMKIEVDIFPPDLFRVVTDEKDYKKIKEVWIPISTVGKDGYTTYSFKIWTDAEYLTADIDSVITSREPNKYGRIPAAILQFKQSRTNFYGGGLWELILATLDDNKLCFLVNNDVVYSAFAIWVATNFDAKQNIQLTPNKLLRVQGAKMGEGQTIPAQIESINGQGSFAQIEELRDSRLKKAMRKSGLPTSLIDSNPGIAPSGVALQIDKQELMEIRKEDIGVMTKFENEFYPIFAKVINTDLKLSLPEKSKVGIDYVEQGEYIAPDVKQATLDMQFNKGIIGAKDYLANFTANELVQTDNEAIEYMLTNLKNLERLKIDTDPKEEISQQGTSGVVPAE